ncbi:MULTISPECIES: phage tail protein [Dickeya]|uniref:Phage tail protein n=1 Tax=Dickeya fangzhongdai TaxID=1778540 RepID=A0A2K8QQH5_9GAMM|nr:MULTISPECIES: phage tail protein [Dickeya]ATZ95777.1 phage tail protein [Dickeya fangzhongdai]AYH49423.1 phage tail protein [Dickeya fangzhongdai]KHN58492.1 phage tail protein [Dickeya fangzhongdai]MBO8135575.1 phage tail protein [Dickeya fangzhongdai]QOH49221.1 phage tail protein [Dickeya fangzhongdai]
MADDGSAQSSTVWPMPKFHFEVKWDGGAGASMVASFQEITGLDIEAQIIEYRAGNSPVFSTIKMPGIIKSGNVTLKKGIFVKDNNFYDWFSKIKMNTIARTAVTINLLDESGSPAMTWKLKNAWPTKVSGTDLKSDGNEVAIETIELAHEGLEVAV